MLLFDKIKILRNIFQRIYYFRRMYPLKIILMDLILFPIDYYLNNGNIQRVRNITFAITHKCNIRCEMCYFHKRLKGNKELSVRKFKEIIDMVKSKRPGIILSGGEPFTHPGVIDMVAYAKKMGLAVQIFTNGALVKKDLTTALVKSGLDYIDFTLLGDEKSHSLVAGVPDAYNMFIENLRYFSENKGNTKVILNYTITPRSLRGIRHAAELAKQYGLDGVRIQHYNFMLPNESVAHDNLIKDLFNMDSSTHEIEDGGNLEWMIDEIITFKEESDAVFGDIPVQWAPTLTDTEIVTWYSGPRFSTQRRCLYPWRGILIDADGKLYPCSKIYLELGDTNNKNVFVVWNSMVMRKFRKKLRKGLFPACSRCCKL